MVTSILHSQAAGIHPAAYVGSVPPDAAALGLQNHVLWIDNGAAPTIILKYWNAESETWISIMGGVDTTGILSADCVTFPRGAVLCNPSTDLVTLVTPTGTHQWNATGYTLPGGHRFERVPG